MAHCTPFHAQRRVRAFAADTGMEFAGRAECVRPLAAVAGIRVEIAEMLIAIRERLTLLDHRKQLAGLRAEAEI